MARGFTLKRGLHTDGFGLIDQIGHTKSVDWECIHTLQIWYDRRNLHTKSHRVYAEKSCLQTENLVSKISSSARYSRRTIWSDKRNLRVCTYIRRMFDYVFYLPPRHSIGGAQGRHIAQSKTMTLALTGANNESDKLWNSPTHGTILVSQISSVDFHTHATDFVWTTKSGGPHIWFDQRKDIHPDDTIWSPQTKSVRPNPSVCRPL